MFMANDYFKFKQFVIYQNKCAMKVCTDACLFGSIVSAKTNLIYDNILDIGAGTGLLSLMYAQKNPSSKIDAVEINYNAFSQAKENFSISKWNNRLKVFYSDINKFSPDKKYDFIITNPPFYENELLSFDDNKNIARHDTSLNLKELIRVIKIHLLPTGIFAILLPYHRILYFEKVAEENNLFLQEKIIIRQTPNHNFFRGILFFTFCKTEVKKTELNIKLDDGKYTDEFIKLMKDYYLKL